MKPAFILTIIALLIWSCAPGRHASKTSAVLTQKSPDSTVYEVVIIDIHFDQWYMMNYSEAKDRSNELYHSKNLVAAANWNDYYRLGKYSEVIDSYINYEPQIDYGIEVNRKLYWYFKYVQESYHVRLF